MGDIVQQAEEYGLSVWVGKSFSLELQYTDDAGTPISLDGYTVAGQLREFAGGALLTSFDVVSTGTAGVVLLSLSPVKTRALKPRAVYDVEATSPSGDVIGLLRGEVEHLIAEVTQ